MAKRKKQEAEAEGPAKPDDLLDGCRPTPAAKKHADALATCDLECLLIQLGGDTPRNRELLRELRRFLVLKAITQDGDGGTPPTLSPSTMVDRGWHALMLRPRLYLTVCAALGSPDVIDHDPMGGKDAAARAERLARTMEAYKGIFGVAPPAELWGDQALAAGDAADDVDGRMTPEQPAQAAALVVAAAPAAPPQPQAVVGAAAAPLPAAAGPAPGHLPPQEAPVPEVTITLKFRNQEGQELNFRVRRTTTFEKLFKAYCERKAVTLAGTRFYFDGSHILPTDTAASLEMEEGDTVEVTLDQCGC